MLQLAQSALLKLQPELAHDITISSLKKTQRSVLSACYKQTLPEKPVTVAGIRFPHPVGLAAGLDKNGECVDAFLDMGFGFVEVGTVTPRPQAGNPKPRLFRIPEKKAVINRMGFNNKGVESLVSHVSAAKNSGVVGINVGKNKDTPEDKALDDYLYCVNKAYNHCDYLAVNISSPNTPGLRNLQYGEALDALLAGLKAAQETLSQAHSKYVPIFVKIAPDLTDDEIGSIAKSLVEAKMDGVISTNTTLSRDTVKGFKYAEEAGGLSGAVLKELSLSVTQKLCHAIDGAMPVIGVGGIDSPQAAKDMLNAGASLVQLYTSFIYQGPGLIKRIVNAL